MQFGRPEIVIFRRAENVIWPFPGCYRISSPFDPRFHPILRKWKDHEGIDIAAPAGKIVVSISSGIVTHTGWIDGYGKTVIVKDNRHRYLFAHLSSIAVDEGESVSPNKNVGKIDITGRTNGPHLHFGIYDLCRESWIDPMLILQGKRGEVRF
ncbi:MAG: M23 family metallopeptidase [Clostridiales bacterium]|nr:M23 family metallopeptidase [Clostridiales bacterium]MCF8021971.1 M23 family metallopeptidase [Clostridiales bacterium]